MGKRWITDQGEGWQGEGWQRSHSFCAHKRSTGEYCLRRNEECSSIRKLRKEEGRKITAEWYKTA